LIMTGNVMSVVSINSKASWYEERAEGDPGITGTPTYTKIGWDQK